MDASSFRPNAKVIAGGFLIAVGLLFTLDGFGVIDAGSIWEYWPLILIFVGIKHLFSPAQPGQRTWGLIEVAFGAFFLLRNLGVFWISLWKVWPIMLVVAGGHMIWQARFGPKSPDGGPGGDGGSGDDGAGGPSAEPDRRLNEVALFGGGDRAIRTTNFRGGSVVAIFGGFDIDLREAVIVGDTVYIDVTVLFGGVDLKVPEGWNVMMRATPILGSAEYKPRPAAPAEGPVKTLVVTGVVIFGGVEVKN
jgi:hypothetical protein